MIKSHSIRIYPTKRQEILFRKSCGVARYSYNWALAKWKELYEAGEKPSAYKLVKLQNSIKREQMPFFMEVTKCAPQYAIHHVEAAFKKFFKKNAKYPKFKKKGINDCFVAVDNKEAFYQKDFKIHIPRVGKVRCAENLRFEGKVNNVTVKRIADMWFAVINIETIPADILVAGENQAVIGVDVGIKSMLITSEGRQFGNPRPLKRKLRSLKHAQRSLSRKVKGSRNRYRQQMKVAKKHYKISCIRKYAIHNATTSIVKSADVIVIENLNVSGMIKNRSVAQALSDVSLSEIHRQIKYKAAWAGKTVIVADRFYASSKTCSCCGYKKDILKLSERIFRCENCGIEIDRDLNAAKNLANYGSTPKCGESKASGCGSSALVHSPQMKEELGSNCKQLKF